MCIEFSVGRNGANRVDDVKTVQILLNMNLYRLMPFRAVPETGSIDAITLDAIDAFFKKVMSENDVFRGVPFRVPSRTEATSNQTAMRYPSSAMRGGWSHGSRPPTDLYSRGDDQSKDLLPAAMQLHDQLRH
jgi:hypothetical protein